MAALVISPWVNSAPLIALQFRLLQRFCKEPFELIVVNDAEEEAHLSNFFDAGAWRDIEQACAALSVTHLRVPQDLHRDRHKLYASPMTRRTGPSVRACDAIQFALRERGLVHDGPVLVIDSDMFSFADFSVTGLLDGAHLAGIPQRRSHRYLPWITAHYIWTGFFAFDAATIPRKDRFVVDCGRIKGIPTDAGGSLHKYFQAAPALKFKPLRHLASLDWTLDQAPGLPGPVADYVRADRRNRDGRCFSEIYEGIFLHMRAGSDWDRDGSAQVRYRDLQRCLSELLP